MAATIDKAPAFVQFGSTGELPGWVWAAMHTATRMALRNPGTVPVVEAATAHGCVMVIDSVDFRALMARLEKEAE